MAEAVSKSWFAVLNNPQDHGYPGEPAQVISKLISEWVEGKPTRTCAMTFCISPSGMPHVHMVLEDVKAMRFSAVKKSFAPGAHFEPTKGSKEQAENYIKKKGIYEEKGEQILWEDHHGEIKGCQGKRRDLEIIGELIEQGYTPDQIMDMNISYRLHQDVIKGAFFSKRKKETPFMRDVKVFYHVGDPGSGKSYTANILKQQLGADNVFFVSQYNTGYLDEYMGEKLLFLDEFKSGIPFGNLLVLLDCYTTLVHSRYHNTPTLWNEVHITSVFPPERLYSNMVTENQDLDTIHQLLRRISVIVYHYKENGEYKQFSLDAENYKDYDSLKAAAIGKDGFIPVKQCSIFD